MEKILEQISIEIEKDKNELLENLKKQVAIQSVEGEPEEGAPFGKKVAKALDNILELGEKMGFVVKNHEGYVGTIEWGEGEELLGVLTHVDVVSPGDESQWNTPPYEMTEQGGFICGRGVVDDKGPLISSLYGMNALKKLGFKPNKRIRIIIGANEETGWGCMSYYKEHCEAPHKSFSPDGMFTAVNSEKGIFSGEYEKKLNAEGISIAGGEAENLVPAKAVAVLPLSVDSVNKAINDANFPEGVSFTCEKCSQGVKLTCKGKSAHAMTPKKGVSSIVGLLNVLQVCEEMNKELKAALKEILVLLGKEPDGEAMGIACEDEVSGELTVNLGMLSLKDNRLSLEFDVRSPVTTDLDTIVANINEVLKECGYENTNSHIKHPLHVPADTPLINKLCEVYKVVAKEEPTIHSIGGGTYARAFQNCVCFGSVYPNEELTVHSVNERTLKSNIIQNAKMYGLAIYALSN